MKDLASILFSVNGTRKAPAAGEMLVAQPFLKETFFTHGVVSVIDFYPEEGATGVVLNNPTEYKLADLLEGVSDKVPVPVFCGGPTGQDRLFFIHTLGPEIIADARPYAPGLYVGGNFDDAIGFINDGYPFEGNIRFFLGHSNWVEGQLERELIRGTWATPDMQPQPDFLLRGSSDAMWHRAVKLLGEDYRSWALIPRNAVCN